MAIYQNIKKLAKEKRVPVYMLENAAGLSSGSICKWDSVSPSVNNLKKVADILGTTVDELIKDQEGA